MTTQYSSWVDEPVGEAAVRPVASTGWATVRAGATLCLRLELIYTLGFVLYALARSALTVFAAGNPDAGVMGTLVATWAALVIASALIAALLAIPVALLGGITAAIIHGVGRALNLRGEAARAALIGMGVCAGAMLLLHAALRAMMNFAAVDLLAPHALFWIELPGLIFVVAGSVLGRRALSSRSE